MSSPHTIEQGALTMSQTATAAGVSAITWFEIPTADFDRARRFYETVLGTTLREEPFGPARIAIFPREEPGMTGCLDEASGSHPSDGGTVVYLKVADGELDRTLARVEGAGGSIAALVVAPLLDKLPAKPRAAAAKSSAAPAVK